MCLHTGRFGGENTCRTIEDLGLHEDDWVRVADGREEKAFALDW